MKVFPALLLATFLVVVHVSTTDANCWINSDCSSHLPLCWFNNCSPLPSDAGEGLIVDVEIDMEEW